MSDGTYGELRFRFLLIGSLLVVLVVAAVSLAAAQSVGLLSAGSQTARLTVVMRSGGKSTFSGQLAGRSLVGKFEHVDAGIERSLCPKDSPGDIGTSFTYTGTFQGRRYTFSGCVDVRTFTFRLEGRLGSVSFSGRATWRNWQNQHGLDATFPFTGRIGNQAVNGTATLPFPPGPSGKGKLIARLKVGL